MQRWTNEKREIVLDGCDPEVLSAVVGFMYGKDLPELAVKQHFVMIKIYFFCGFK